MARHNNNKSVNGSHEHKSSAISEIKPQKGGERGAGGGGDN